MEDYIKPSSIELIDAKSSTSYSNDGNNGSNLNINYTADAHGILKCCQDLINLNSRLIKTAPKCPRQHEKHFNGKKLQLDKAR